MSIKRFSFGNIIDCDSVVKCIKAEESNDIPYFSVEEGKLILQLEDDDIVYGLGENVRGINKRGWMFESYCSDDPNHSQDKKSLYGAHNFILVHGIQDFGVLIDTPSKVNFDIGYTNNDELTIDAEGNPYDLYVIEGNSLENIVQSFRELIGMSYVPPKWAFGYGQSRWSYANEEEVLNVKEQFIKRDLPIDSIYLDIDYMERFKNFTIDRGAFENFESMTSNIKKDGIRLVPIIDAGVKVEDGYDVYEEGVEKGYFCKDKSGNPFVAAVWPGKVHFPDFLNKDARLWFGKKYKWLIDKGIEGFWNDMNEPAIFYSEEGLKRAYKKVEESKDKNLDIYSFFNLKDAFLGLSNSSEDYNSFYHNMDGKILKHNDVHNLYGHNMTRAAKEGLDEIDNNKRFLLFSRASSIGMHRYGGIWTGDNSSLWEHLEMNVKMMPNLNMCGYLYTGADTGGFGGNCTGDLLTRWFQFSIFTPLFRNHSAMGTRKQEPYAFGEKVESNIRNLLQFRYGFIPYLYSEYMKSVLSNKIMFKPLSFEYKDSTSKEIEDQLLLGDSLMIAPVVKQNAKGRYVYVPEDMLMVRCKGLKDLQYEIKEKGHHFIEVLLDEFIFFIKKNKVLLLGDYAKNTDSLNNKELNAVVYLEDKGSYKLYDDDGKSNDYLKGKYDEIEIALLNNNGDVEINCTKKGDIKIEKINFIIILNNGEVLEKTYSF
ncbi:MAG: glycoside hydrolase family 31 protein [Clostridium sp.]|uniref:TIM-barrel domain-containing protein n=1 Tax=Clostridium sp. TaxID=1506 RepID=UPI002FCAE9A3